MMFMLWYMLMSTLIVLLLLSIPVFMSKLSKKWLEKFMSFECGINLDSSPRKPLSLRFFLLMVLFIIFDIEIAMILIIPSITMWSTQMTFFLNSFLTILSMGIMYEWKEGSLNWKL